MRTPTPWKQDGKTVFKDDMDVADASREDDAEFIVLACNYHDALLEACKAIIDAREKPGVGYAAAYLLAKKALEVSS